VANKDDADKLAKQTFIVTMVGTAICIVVVLFYAL
jgi:hypothetical protein